MAVICLHDEKNILQETRMLVPAETALDHRFTGIVVVHISGKLVPSHERTTTLRRLVETLPAEIQFPTFLLITIMRQIVMPSTQCSATPGSTLPV